MFQNHTCFHHSVHLEIKTMKVIFQRFTSATFAPFAVYFSQQYQHFKTCEQNKFQSIFNQEVTFETTDKASKELHIKNKSLQQLKKRRKKLYREQKLLIIKQQSKIPIL